MSKQPIQNEFFSILQKHSKTKAKIESVKKILEALGDALAEACQEHDSVRIANLGVFKIVEYPQKLMTISGEPQYSPKKPMLRFRQGAYLEKKLSQK